MVPRCRGPPVTQLAWDLDFLWMGVPVGSYEEIQAKVGQVEAGDEPEINPDVQQIMDLIQDPVEEVHYQYLDFKELWQAYSRDGGEDLGQLIDLVMSQAKYTPMASVPEPLYDRVRETLNAKELVALLTQYISLVRRTPEDPAVGEVYTKLRRLYYYDEEALLRAVIAHSR